MGDGGLGFMFAAAGAGGVVAAGIAAKLADDPRLSPVRFLSPAWPSACPSPALPSSSLRRLPMCSLAIVGAANVILVVVTNTMLQRVVRPDVVSRVFGVLDSLDVVGIVLGSILAPIIVELFGVDTGADCCRTQPPRADARRPALSPRFGRGSGRTCPRAGASCQSPAAGPSLRRLPAGDAGRLSRARRASAFPQET